MEEKQKGEEIETEELIKGRNANGEHGKNYDTFKRSMRIPPPHLLLIYSTCPGSVTDCEQSNLAKAASNVINVSMPTLHTTAMARYNMCRARHLANEPENFYSAYNDRKALPQSS